MAKIDPADLIEPSQVAEILGLNNVGGVSVYRKRYDTFPVPAVDKGRCVLWIRSEVEAWARSRK